MMKSSASQDGVARDWPLTEMVQAADIYVLCQAIGLS